MSWRLPPRLSRCRVTLPDQTGTGARAVVAGERLLGAEAADAGRLAHELGRGEGAAAGQGEQRRARGARRGSRSRARGRGSPRVSSRIRATQVPGDAGDGLGPPGEARPRASASTDGPVERAGRRLRDAELVQVPAQALRRGGCARRRGPRGGRRAGAARARGRRAWRPAGPGSRSAARATARASIGSLLPGSRTERRAPAMSLGGTRTTDSPARRRSASRRRDRWRQSSSAQRPLRAPGGPAAELEVPAPGRRDRLLGELAARSRRPRRRCGCACADRRPGRPCPCLLLHRGDARAGRRTHLSGGEATLLSSHAGRSDASHGRQNAVEATPIAGGQTDMSQAVRRRQHDTQGSDQIRRVHEGRTARSPVLDRRTSVEGPRVIRNRISEARMREARKREAGLWRALVAPNHRAGEAPTPARGGPR